MTQDARRWSVWLGPLAATLFAVTIAGVQYRSFLDDPRPLWSAIQHDRNAHYLTGLALAQSISAGNIVETFHLLDGMRVWGPLHGLLLVPIEMIAGPDYRLGVLPSLCGWVLTMIFGYVVARRIAPWGGDLAGIVAVLFIAASPGHRTFAVDVMLESLGAGLSMICVYLYVALVQERRPSLGWCLGVALSALFLEKYNYFILVVAGLVGAELVRQPGFYWSLAKSAFFATPSWLMAQLCRPTSWLLVAILLAAVGARLLQGKTIRVFGHDMLVGGQANLLHAAWIVLTFRLLVWYRMPQARTQLHDLGPWRGEILAPAWTIVVWFLLPKRIGYFFWYIFVNDQKREHYGLLHGAPLYTGYIANSYHVAAWLAILVVILVVIAACTFRSWRPGGVVALTFLVLAAILTFQHPNLRERFLNSWFASAWVVAGVGVAAIVGAVWRQSRVAGGSFAAICVVGLATVLLPYTVVPGVAEEGGRHPERANSLAMTDTYLPSLADAREPMILSNANALFLLQWTYRERYPHRPFATEIKGYDRDPAANRETARRWLEKTKSDAIVLIDVAVDSRYFARTPEDRDYGVLQQCLAESTRFAPAESWTTAEKVTITIWRRTSS
jgi:hypothetical protein